MNPELLVAHFNRISDAPDAIPRLRRFVLDLAVRGKLAEQDPNDEPASKLLTRIQKKKAEITQDGGVRKEKPLSLLAENDLPFSIPSNWRWSQLAEIGFINPRNIAGDEVLSSFVPMTLISSDYGVANTHEVRPWGEIKSGFTHFAEGDVALAKITPCFENGKSTIFRDLTGGIGAGTTELHVVRPVIVSAEYVLIFLKCPHFVESGTSRMTGTAGQKRVPTEYFSHSPFPLPPLAEQYRIVAKVAELMSLCEGLESARGERDRRLDRLTAASHYLLHNGAGTGVQCRHAQFLVGHLRSLTVRPDQISYLRQTVLSLAVRGRLVPQDSADEPASKLLNRIQAEKVRLIKEGLLRKEKALPSIDEDKIPFVVPKNWAWAKIGTCSLLTEYGTSVRSDANKDGVPVLAMGNIQNGQVVLSERKKVPFHIEDLPQLFLKRSDLLYNRTNSAELVGKTGIFLGDDDAYTFASYLIRIRFLNNLISPAYANLAMNAPYFRATQIVPELQQQCGQANVNGTKLRNMLVPVPPLAEQLRIVAKVDELMKLCNRLEGHLTTAQNDSRSLLEAVLHHSLDENHCETDKQFAFQA